MSYNTVVFEMRRIKYRDGCKTILDIVDDAYRVVDKDLKTSFDSENEPAKREGFLYVTADIFLRCLDIDVRDKWRFFNKKELHLDPAAYAIYKAIENDVLNMALIKHFNPNSPSKGLSETATKVRDRDITDRFVLIHEVFCRLFAVALSNQALMSESYEENGSQILTILQKVIEKLSESQVTLQQSIFHRAKTIFQMGQVYDATEFTEMLRTIPEHIQAARVVIESIHALKRNQKAMNNALAYLKESEKVIRSLIIGEKCYQRGLSILPEDLRPRMLQTTYQIKTNEYNESIEHDERSNYMVSDITHALDILLDDTETLTKLFSHISVAGEVGGWTFWLMNVINIEDLVKELSNHFSETRKIGSRMNKELPGFSNSPSGIAISANNAWPSSVKLGQTNVATCQQFNLLNDPTVRAQLLAKNHSTISELVGIHNNSKFQFINICVASEILGGSITIKGEEASESSMMRRVDYYCQKRCRDLAISAFNTAAHLFFNTTQEVSIQNHDDASFIDRLSTYLQAGFSEYREMQIKYFESNYFSMQLCDYLVHQLFMRGDGDKQLVLNNNFNSRVVLSCIVFAIVDLGKARDAGYAFETHQENQPEESEIYHTFLPSGEVLAFVESVATEPLCDSSIRTLDPAVHFSEKTVAQSVLDQLDTSGDVARNQVIISAIGCEIFSLIQAEPNAPILGVVRAKASNLISEYRKYRQDADQAREVKAKDFEKYHRRLQKQLDSIRQQCLDGNLVYAFIQTELGPKNRLTLGLLRAFAMIHNVALSIYENNPVDLQLTRIYTTAEPTHSTQIHLLKKSVYGFSVLRQYSPSHEHSPSRIHSTGDTPRRSSAQYRRPTSSAFTQQRQDRNDKIRSSRSQSAARRATMRSPRRRTPGTSASPQATAGPASSDTFATVTSSRATLFGSASSRSPVRGSGSSRSSTSTGPISSGARLHTETVKPERHSFEHIKSDYPPMVPKLELPSAPNKQHTRRASAPSISPRSALFAEGNFETATPSSIGETSSECGDNSYQQGSSENLWAVVKKIDNEPSLVIRP